MLKETSESFVQVLLQKPVLQPLYKNRHFTLQLNDTKDTVWISFKDGDCSLLNERPNQIDVYISGEEEQIKALINGKERLMTLEKEGRLRVDGPGRHLLALESLFLLTKGDSRPLYDQT
ncbi:putative sterol carrier protein [Scopulibacillus daqui]|uniref:Sterol carrier protein n=1 Tax=Scopulibacillus daqui TaxID=1469162 RepID=A0ABS2Q4J9_9BACL|nr:SCP2 sterol-binding domain-containing protein [Scopulibacillus daqui]MBM7646417.1 putative sterol carrier protein [Scopulibacillus daqui]